MEAVAARATYLAANSKPQELSALAWSFAALSYPCPPLFKAIASVAGDVAGGASPQSLANLAWAYSTLHPPRGEREDPPPLLAAVDAAAQGLVEEGRPQAVSNAAWAFAANNTDAPNLLPLLDSSPSWLLRSPSPQSVANVLWAYATLRRDCPSLAAHAASDAERLVRGGGTAAALAAASLATLGADAGGFWDELERSAGEVAGGASARHACNLAWALAVAGRGGSPAVKVFWDRAAAGEGGELSWEGRNQLLQVRAFAGGGAGELRGDWEPVAQAGGRSAHADRVGRFLTELGAGHERESQVVSEDLGPLLAVDFAIPSTRTVLELDGPTHFLWGEAGRGRGRETGTTAAKRRLLESRGWRVVNLPWYESRRLEKEGTEAAEKEWLRVHVLGEATK
ncbi:hypothetical protein TeGR_g12674 [Tetraparma gracilis]|uniref:RAP domain-containing protein n=1 Tax=Tetraparma gracilis TaxID=2962635 RepID=A0ABQ6MJE0_9STRA|nr:hypothetical protein TeGR_g12674 [Tetraparma gracilis]